MRQFLLSLGLDVQGLQAASKNETRGPDSRQYCDWSVL